MLVLANKNRRKSKETGDKIARE